MTGLFTRNRIPGTDPVDVKRLDILGNAPGGKFFRFGGREFCMLATSVDTPDLLSVPDGGMVVRFPQYIEADGQRIPSSTARFRAALPVAVGEYDRLTAARHKATGPRTGAPADALAVHWLSTRTGPIRGREVLAWLETNDARATVDKAGSLVALSLRDDRSLTPEAAHVFEFGARLLLAKLGALADVCEVPEHDGPTAEAWTVGYAPRRLMCWQCATGGE